MEISEAKGKECAARLTLARTRILCENGFYGLLLMHTAFALSNDVRTAATDGEKIYFSPAFMDDLSDRELDFVLMHEIVHIVLQHCARYGKRDAKLFNIACDVVVNSNILYSNDMRTASITLKKYGESMHLTPEGKEGYLYTAEEVYEMLLKAGVNAEAQKGWDEHGLWGEREENSPEADGWKQVFKDACKSMAGRGAGALPAFAERYLMELNKPQLDWRTLVNEFVQQELSDYSFFPPDRRFADGVFLLPDYNDTDAVVQNILFMIDTSGSMTEEMITAAYAEVKGAVDQYGGKLKGRLGFFDGDVKEAKAFEDVGELLTITPVGGGGTSFHNVFRYVEREMSDEPPVAIIILTDGFAAFPDESAAMGIPTLWVINNEKIEPPWGKVARIK